MQKKVEYTDAIKMKYLEQVVIAIAKDEKGTANPMTIGWCMPASGSPPMFAIGVAPKRYTAEAIRHSKCFTVVFPSADMRDQVMAFGTKSGRDTDKLAESDLKAEPAAEIDSVILSDAVANFECRLTNEFVTGDHILFIGEVVASHLNEEKKKRCYTVAAGGKLGTFCAE